MLVSDNHKFVFIHIPKTGGSSMTAVLAPFLRKPKPVPPDGTHGWQDRHHRHSISRPTLRRRILASSKPLTH